MKLLSNFNPNKETGPDEISTTFLKEMAHALTQAQIKIFQASMDQGQTLEDRKTSNVPPIFKKGENSKLANYRPMSLTSVCCKVVKHIIHSHPMNFFEYHSILIHYNQHWFRKKRSCESKLITTIQDLAMGIETNTQIDAVLLDFSKAFDKVPHETICKTSTLWCKGQSA